MKKIDFPLDQIQLDALTSSIREKKDVVCLWMRALKLVSAYVPPDPKDVCGCLAIRVDKMSRIFVEAPEKSISLNFPFSVREDGGEYEFGTKNCSPITSKITSDVLSLVSASDLLGVRQLGSFVDLIIDTIGDDHAVWELLRDLMVCDDGYIRIDHDEKNKNGNLHPVDHADIFYSQPSTFKVGLEEFAKLDIFVDMLNIKTECHFLYK